MIQFYPHRTVEEQKARLPQAFQDNYRKTVLDQVEINGNIIRGYFEYSFLNEKSYFEQPARSLNGSIENINTYATFLTPRLIIKYNMMNIEDYRNLMTLLQSKNEFTVTCYDPVLNERVTHKMYAAPTSMPIIYQRYLMALGVQEFSIELIGTNNGLNTYELTYDYNLPYEYSGVLPQQTATQVFSPNASGVVGINATYTIGNTTYPLNSSKTTELLGGKYAFECWNTKADGSGMNYIDGDTYFFNSNKTLYAKWRRGGYTATIISHFDEEYGPWLSYSTDGGQNWFTFDEEDYELILPNVAKIRFNWEPTYWAEASVFYGGYYDEELSEWVNATYVQRDTDIELKENTTFYTSWQP